MSSRDFPKYTTASEVKQKAQKSIEKLKKKKEELQPVVIQGRKLAVTWWGMAWNENLTKYSDYVNRIDRGKTYARNGSILDLKIHEGVVDALVQGSRAKPYKVNIEITPLNEKVWSDIKKNCQGKIETLQELIEGKFPEALSDLFTAKGTGLFPTPKEISMECSCPDWAIMCKHVAAVFYGIGARLDTDPAIFFKLRNIKMEELISEVIRKNTEGLLEKADVKSNRVLDDSDIGNMFGLELEAMDQQPVALEKPKRVRKSSRKE